ncbi:MAG TPA: tRNA (adenosine(37)-N6)-threonylcarbamoyltransferase complex dimerization subunit type 1 TsaB [bacterium]|nr:tRNA (adenosine(37)-N6)-threonylcarbamoyltransferase complex dimerization subunit type 1 TsaB [bacterium]HOL47656.1 tRNA (adenosine(37)-N6)-threonylcarbamoyltransferase complex dimerization subunit type 1 TsaB [bacterium]HPQ18414.1 tRNA (adenosine(37)-N6)-threonylcarbamoyltransferase complex dimerization subunit type 1 TsaB [bacterium]
MFTLFFDTSSEVSTLAIADNEKNKLLCEFSTYIKRTHSEQFWLNIEYLFNELKIEKKRISEIVVGIGPGSFTGLRIGLSAAKGIARANKAKLFTISSLDLLANKFYDNERIIVSAIDAKKGEIYFAIYTHYINEKIKLCSQYSLRKPEEFINSINKEAIIVGSGALTYKDYILKNARKKVIINDNEIIHQVNAIDMYILHRQKLTKEVKINELEPMYLRKSDAEIKLEEKLNVENRIC